MRKYDWDQIINDQKSSGLSIKKYCEENDISVSSFYKYNSQLKTRNHSSDYFIPVEVVEHRSPLIRLIVNENIIEFDVSLLDQVIGALK